MWVRWMLEADRRKELEMLRRLRVSKAQQSWGRRDRTDRRRKERA
jgi:hypothetical protein